MQIKKFFLSQRLTDGTVSGGVDNPAASPGASFVVPYAPTGGYGTGMVNGQEAILIRNDGPGPMTFWFVSGSGPAPVPNKTQLAGHGSSIGPGTVTVAPGKSTVLLNGGNFTAFSYTGGPGLVMNGGIYYAVDLDPNNSWAQVVS